MRWPNPRFFQSYVGTIVFVLIFAFFVGSPPIRFFPGTVQANSPTYSAAIVDYAFQPQRINVTTGTEVIWINHGSTQHTVTSSPQTNTTQGGTPLISSGPMNTGQNFSYTFYKHGLYPIQCAFHPTVMNGLVNVTGTDVQPPSPSATTSPTDYTPYAIGGAIGAAIGIASVALLLRRRTHKAENTSRLHP